MAQTYAVAGLTPQIWDDEFFRDYVRMSRYKRYMGTDEAAIFQLKEDLTKKRGDRVTFALVNELTGAGVTGNSTLKGNEERLNSRSDTAIVDVLRHAVAVDDWDVQKSVIDLRQAARVQLREWAQKTLRNDCTTALGMVANLAFASATNAQRDTWQSDNRDRLVFGTTTINQPTFASAISAVTAGAQLSPNILSLMKRLAQSASPKVKPVYVKEMDQEWYVAFVGPRAWRDLTEDNPTTNVLTLANRDARVRGVDNPLFTGDSLVWDGMILREIPEIAALPSAVASISGLAIEPVYLCGAQAVGLAWSQRTKSTTDTDDYGFLHGVGVQEIRGIKKLRFGTDPAADTTTPKDHGIVTAFVAAAAD